MDAQGFRLKDKNSFFNPAKWDTIEEAKIEVKASGYTLPADDSRYPAFAAPMSDARTFTDYRSHCQTRVPAAYTQPVKQWMIHNGESLIELNRKRAANNTGATLPMAATAPPAETLVFCDPFGCEMQATGEKFGQGIETVNDLPDMPGTFMYRPDPEVVAANRKNTLYNLVNENGRNTSRRWEVSVPGAYS